MISLAWFRCLFWKLFQLQTNNLNGMKLIRTNCTKSTQIWIISSAILHQIHMIFLLGIEKTWKRKSKRKTLSRVEEIQLPGTQRTRLILHDKISKSNHTKKSQNNLVFSLFDSPREMASFCVVSLVAKTKNRNTLVIGHWESGQTLKVFDGLPASKSESTSPC